MFSSTYWLNYRVANVNYDVCNISSYSKTNPGAGSRVLVGFDISIFSLICFLNANHLCWIFLVTVKPQRNKCFMAVNSGSNSRGGGVD